MSGLIVLAKYTIRAVVAGFRTYSGTDNKSANAQNDTKSNTKPNTKPPQSNNENDSIWIINGKIYDLTPFLNYHPGGKHMLLINRGRDCTELFYSYHLSSAKDIKYMESILKTYYVCDASPSEHFLSPFNWNGKNYEMYLDFKSRVQRYFNENKHSNREKATYYRLFWYLFLFLSMLTVYRYWFRAYWIAVPLLSLLHWLLSTELLHNGTHYQLSHNPYINILLSMIGGFYHAPNIQWEMQHVISHHSYTNIDTLDIDLNHFLDNYRTSKMQPYRAIYAKWRLFMPLYILFTSIGQIDVWGANANRNIHRVMVPYFTNNSKWTFVLIVYCIQTLWIFAVLPLALCYQLGGISYLFKAFLFNVLQRMGHGALFYVFSQISHIQGDAFYKTDELETDSWIKHQIQSSVDYSIHSTFWNFMSLGLNNQAIHHLCPAVHIGHFMDMQPMLDEFCADYNIKRRVFPNILVTLYQHFRHLAIVNDNAKLD